MVRKSDLPWSVVRAMPFYYLLEKMLAGLAWLPVWPVPKTSFNPVDTSDVADYLATCAMEGPRGVRDEIGGPEDLSPASNSRASISMRGDMHRPILPLLSEKSGARHGLCRQPWRARQAAMVRLVATRCGRNERRGVSGAGRHGCVTRQIVPLPSSDTSSAPSRATATPTGRPQTSESLTTKPVTKSSYSPVGTPSLRRMRMTL